MKLHTAQLTAKGLSSFLQLEFTVYVTTHLLISYQALISRIYYNTAITNISLFSSSVNIIVDIVNYRPEIM